MCDPEHFEEIHRERRLRADPELARLISEFSARSLTQCGRDEEAGVDVDRRIKQKERETHRRALKAQGVL